MAKVKNKRNSGLADKVHGKKKAEAHKKKLNPFEVHINKEKLKVLGKKSKHDRGLPGVSRAKAIQKRKETLGTEMKLMHKTNAFIDRRIGEKNLQLSAEERMVARFAAERAKQHNRKSIYNLADDEILTHRGQTLEQIEKFDDPRSSDEENDDGRKGFGGLDNDFVSEGHFGGGMLAKSENDGAKSHKDLIEQLIAESKKRKAEKQKEKEQTLDLTEKLDSEWKDLQPVVFKRARVEEKESIIDKLLGQAEKKGEDYDKMMRELKFDRRGTPSDGLKSDEKLAKEERERLAKLEKEMLQRMAGDDEVAPRVAQAKGKHRSADDLDDNFELEDEKEFMLAYDKDGKPLVPEHVLKDYSVPNAKPKFDDGISDTSSDDDDGESDDNDDSGEEQTDGESSAGHEERDDSKKSKVKQKDTKLKNNEICVQESDSEESSDDENDDNQKSKLDANARKLKNNESCVQESDSEESSVDEKDDNYKSKLDTKARTLKNNEKSVHESDSEESSDDEKDDNQKNNKIKADTSARKMKNNEKNVQVSESEESSDDDDVKSDKKDKVQKKSVDDSTNKIGKEKGNLKTQTKEQNKINPVQNGKASPESADDKSDEQSNGDASGDEEEGSDDEESNDDDGNQDKVKLDDFRDLMVSDQESESGSDDEENEENVKSFFDIQADEGENLKELLAGKTPSQQATVVQKLIKQYDPSLAENNKDKLSRLYAHMLQYVNDIFTNLQNEGDVLKAFLIFDKLAPLFYNLANTNKVSTKKFLVELLKEKHDRFRKNRRKVPDLDTLIFFKLVSLLYPTSDFRHPVTTPSLIFMSEILTVSKFNNAYSISRGFFIVALILEYTVLSKRFVPAAINLLRGILYLSANISILNPIQVVPPFKLQKDSKLLHIEDDCSKTEIENKMAAKDLVLKEIDNDFKIRSLMTCTLMLREFFDNFNDIEAQEAIFEPHIHLYSRIDIELYPKKVRSIVNEAVKYMKGGLEVKTYTPLSREKKRPKALRLYEPDIQEVFTGSKSSKLPRELAERRRLQSKVKKEMKGALREIRRDKAYIASVKIRQKIHSDNVRKDKVKQIYKDAAIQQGELNKLKRMK